MPKPVMISVSGIRGIVGEGLSPELLVNFSAAVGTFYGRGRVMVGRDSRMTGDMVKHAVFSGLMSVGCDPVDLGVVPTPTTQLAVEHSDAVGGIVVTASHNPVEWNALKLLSAEGLFLDEAEGAEVKRIAETKS
ncbi:MAG TPA: phosphoglucosamine mutase, partial [bacterium]